MPLTFSLPILHRSDRLHTAPPTPHHWPSFPPRVSIGTLNIRDGQGFGFDADHPGIGIQGVQRDAPDIDEDLDGVILPQLHGLRHDVFGSAPIQRQVSPRQHRSCDKGTA